MADFGSDISTFPDLDPAFALRTGPHVVAEAVARRFITPRGSLFWDPAFGFDTRALLNDAIPASQLPTIASQLETEAMKDERVLGANVSVTQNFQQQTIAIKCELTLATGPFAFTLTIGQVQSQQTLIFGK